MNYVVSHGGWLLANAPADHFGPSLADVVVFAAFQTAIVLVAVRFGLLTMVVAWLVSGLLTLLPIAIDSSVPYASSSRLMVATVLALATVVVLLRPLATTLFDADFAGTAGLRVRALELLMTALLVVAVVVGLRAVGAILMVAMLVVPTTAARQLTDRFGLMLVLAGLIGAAVGVAGSLLAGGGYGRFRRGIEHPGCGAGHAQSGLDRDRGPRGPMAEASRRFRGPRRAGGRSRNRQSCR